MAQPEIALDANGIPLVDRELIVLFNLRKRGTNSPTNVTIRGVSPIGMKLRPEVKLAAGRMFRPGSAEIVTGRDIAQRFAGAGLGETLHFALRDWTVVGVLDAGNTAFSSEIWGDIDQMQQAFRRPIFPRSSCACARQGSLNN